MSLTPTVFWAQRAGTVYLKIDLQDVQNSKIDLNEENSTLSFQGSSQGKEYAVNFEFFGGVLKEDSKTSITGRSVEFQIKKKESGYWDRLLKEGGKRFWLKVDLNKWKDEDEDEGNDFNL